MYKLRQEGKHYNCGIRKGEQTLFLYRMKDQPITKYRSRTHPHPYLTGTWGTTIEEAETSIPDYVWRGNAENNQQWRLVKEEVMAERGATCERCGSRVNLDLHHIKAPRYEGKMSKPMHNCSANPAMCKQRYMETTNGCNEGKPDDANVSRPVWGEG